MTSYKRIATALLIAGALLTGCDVSSPGGATTPAPAPAASPAPATADTVPAPPAGQGTAYPDPFPPGYVPPTPP